MKKITIVLLLCSIGLCKSNAQNYFTVQSAAPGAAPNLIQNSTTFSIGIGTATPKSALDVNGGIAIGSYAGTYAAPSNGMIVEGFLGIGTATPTNQLQVVGDAVIDGTIAVNGFQLNAYGTAVNYILAGDLTGLAGWVNPLTVATQNIYNSDGTLSGDRTMTMGAHNLTFNSTSGNVVFNPSVGGVSVGITPTGTSALEVGNLAYSSGHSPSELFLAENEVPGTTINTANSSYSIAAVRIDNTTSHNAIAADFSVDANGLVGIGVPAADFNPLIYTPGSYSGSLLGVIDPNPLGTTPLLTVATNTNNPIHYNLAALTVDYRGYTSLGEYFPTDFYINPAHLFLTDPNPSGTDPLLWVWPNTHTTSLYIASNGQVGIGTEHPAATLDVQGVVRIGNVSTPNALTSPGYSLYVQYGVLAESFKIASSTGSYDWSDYVFDKDYKLPALSEVENYIKDNKHLPGVPSTDDVQCDGIDLAKMDATLLKKIEELTLYVLQLKKDNEDIKKDNVAMKEQLLTIIK